MKSTSRLLETIESIRAMGVAITIAGWDGNAEALCVEVNGARLLVGSYAPASRDNVFDIPGNDLAGANPWLEFTERLSVSLDQADQLHPLLRRLRDEYRNAVWEQAGQAHTHVNGLVNGPAPAPTGGLLDDSEATLVARLFPHGEVPRTIAELAARVEGAAEAARADVTESFAHAAGSYVLAAAVIRSAGGVLGGLHPYRTPPAPDALSPIESALAQDGLGARWELRNYVDSLLDAAETVHDISHGRGAEHYFPRAPGIRQPGSDRPCPASTDEERPWCVHVEVPEHLGYYNLADELDPEQPEALLAWLGENVPAEAYRAVLGRFGGPFDPSVVHLMADSEEAAADLAEKVRDWRRTVIKQRAAIWASRPAASTP